VRAAKSGTSAQDGGVIMIFRAATASNCTAAGESCRPFFGGIAPTGCYAIIASQTINTNTHEVAISFQLTFTVMSSAAQ